MSIQIERVSGKTDATACPVCNSNSALWIQLPAAALLRCAKCDHCFTDVSSISKEETYGSDYYQVTHRNSFENPNYPLFTILSSEIVCHKF